MLVGVHAKGAFKRERNGVEEYVHQLIKHLLMIDETNRFIFLLYTPPFSKTDLNRLK